LVRETVAPTPNPALEAAQQWLRLAEGTIGPRPDELPTNLAGKVAVGLGRAPGDIPRYVAASRLTGSPITGMGRAAGLLAADQGITPAMIAGAKGGLLGAALKGTEGLTTPARMTTLGTLGATTAAAEGGDASDVAAGGLVMGALGGLGGPGRYRFSDLA